MPLSDGAAELLPGAPLGEVGRRQPILFGLGGAELVHAPEDRVVTPRVQIDGAVSPSRERDIAGAPS